MVSWSAWVAGWLRRRSGRFCGKSASNWPHRDLGRVPGCPGQDDPGCGVFHIETVFLRRFMCWPSLSTAPGVSIWLSSPRIRRGNGGPAGSQPADGPGWRAEGLRFLIRDRTPGSPPRSMRYSPLLRFRSSPRRCGHHGPTPFRSVDRQRPSRVHRPHPHRRATSSAACAGRVRRSLQHPPAAPWSWPEATGRRSSPAHRATSGFCAVIDLAASSTNTRRSRDVTQFSGPHNLLPGA
jgi:hypothetical protein